MSSEPSSAAANPFVGVRWVFFDLGNTLVDHSDAIDDWVDQVRDVLRGQRRDSSKQSVQRMLADAATRYAPKFMADVLTKVAGDDVALRSRLNELTYRRSVLKPYPGATSLLRVMHRRYRLGIVANSDTAREELDKNGWSEFMSACITSGDVGVKKPSAEIFTLALHKAGCRVSEAVMIGDRVDNDIRPAKALGWKTIRILQGFARFQKPRDDEDVADATVESLREVAALLNIRVDDSPD